jgi:hypothetical protein
VHLSEVAFAASLGPGWRDWGWAPRELAGGGPARLDLSHHGGWILARPNLSGRFGALAFRFRAPASFGDFLEARVDSGGPTVFPRIALGPAHRTDLEGGWSQVVIPMAELNPGRSAFDRIVIRAVRDVGRETVELDQIGLTELGSEPAEELARSAAPREISMAIDCSAKGRRINPGIYGIAFDPRLDARENHQWELGASGRRWGGNASSRYNWELGNAWNTASDWFFRNVDFAGKPGAAWERFLDDDLAHGVQSALTVPIIGWVAKDTTSFSFPVSEFGPQQSTDPYQAGAGNGLTPRSKPIAPGPATRTSLAAPPESIGRWVSAIRQRDAKRGARSVQSYILDNEPMLWNSTHRDVHPDPVGYDELLERTIAYGGAVRSADPGATIAGPALWGWPAYFYSAKDASFGFALHPDRLRHGNEPLLPWYLKKLRQHERATGVRILDRVDVHFYPQGEGVRSGKGGATDPETNARRIRATRSLWDPSYVDESWIRDTIRLVPRLREWIEESYPGLGISIGEYSFGAEEHPSGGLALAEALGRFGQLGVESAYYWTYPAKGTPAFSAFRAFRNYDGKGGRFLDWSVPAKTQEGASLFASRDDGNRLVAVALNFDSERPASARVDLNSCGKVATRRVFVASADHPALVERAPGALEAGTLSELLPPYSIVVFELERLPAGPGK